MNSIVTLYFNSLVNSEKNFILDSQGHKAIENYLSTLPKVVISDFQYVKHSLSLAIKINRSQETLSMGANSQDLNYVKIQNGNENPLYYFVANKTWKSENTIELMLLMDTLNSFEYNKDYVINKKTLVKREHKDRFSSIVKQGTGPLTTMKKYKRIIDLKSEDINCPLYKNNEATIYESSRIINWDLYYKNRNNPVALDQAPINPVDCFLVPDVSFAGQKIVTNNTISRADIPSGKYILVFSNYNMLASFNIDGAYFYPSQETDTHNSKFIEAIALYNDGSNFKIYKGDVRSYSGGETIYGSWNLIATNPTLVICNTINLSNELNGCQVDSLPNATSIINDDYNNYNKVNFTLSLTGTTTEVTIKSEQNIDRTDAKNIKLISLPYSPTPYKYEYDEYRIDPVWKINDDLYLQLTNTSTKFKNEFEAYQLASPLNVLYIAESQVTYYASEDIRDGTTDEIFESKLYHSDFYRPKFVYDSFSLNLDLEKVDGDYYWSNYHSDQANPKLKINFITSSNIVSKFMFLLPQYKLTKSVSDYDNIICASRNNEKVLYTSQYIDYIRMGYNYDMKAKERNDQTAGIGIGLNMAGLIASIGLSFIPGAQPIGIASAIGSGIGLASQLVNYAKTTAQGEENIQRKLLESQNQAVAVRNADDVDLLEAYSENKAKLCFYAISDKTHKALADLFYYCGYNCYEQKVPNVQTRKWFNFVQAELVINESSNLTSEIEEDIKNKFNNGVTFIHYKDDQFDLAQVKLNLETWMYNI